MVRIRLCTHQFGHISSLGCIVCGLLYAFNNTIGLCACGAYKDKAHMQTYKAYIYIYIYIYMNIHTIHTMPTHKHIHNTHTHTYIYTHNHQTHNSYIHTCKQSHNAQPDEENSPPRWTTSSAANGAPATPSSPAGIALQDLEGGRGEWKTEFEGYIFKMPHEPSGLVVPAGTIVKRFFDDGQVPFDGCCALMRGFVPTCVVLCFYLLCFAFICGVVPVCVFLRIHVWCTSLCLVLCFMCGVVPGLFYMCAHNLHA